MESSLSSFFETLFAVVITTLGIAFIAYAIGKYAKYDKFLIDRNDHKSTSNYTTAYMGFEADYSSAMVLNDITSSEVMFIQINGTLVGESILTNAREGSEPDLIALKSMLNGNYKKSYVFSMDGTITGLVYTSH